MARPYTPQSDPRATPTSLHHTERGVGRLVGRMFHELLTKWVSYAQFSHFNVDFMAVCAKMCSFAVANLLWNIRRTEEVEGRVAVKVPLRGTWLLSLRRNPATILHHAPQAGRGLVPTPSGGHPDVPWHVPTWGRRHNGRWASRRLAVMRKPHSGLRSETLALCGGRSQPRHRMSEICGDGGSQRATLRASAASLPCPAEGRRAMARPYTLRCCATRAGDLFRAERWDVCTAVCDYI